VRVLLLANEGDLASAVSDLLGLEEIQVRHVADLASALSALAELELDALVVDGTFQAAREREFLAAVRDAPVVPGIVLLSTDAGCLAVDEETMVLEKPFEARDLYLAVRAAVRVTRARRASGAG
jgi:DNA-binding NtrC family response regulator